jgi:hypothetical protein
LSRRPTYSEKDRTGWKPEFSKLEIPEIAALTPKNEHGVAVRRKIGVIIGGSKIVVERMVVDWVEVADWDNDGDLDLTRQPEKAPMAER